jgi:uncharacterized iron-regulated protein
VGGWAKWYQPIVDAAKDKGASVVAANAPRRYVRLARTEGYERLYEIPRERREWFDLPRGRLPENYRQRFEEVMREAAEEEAKQIAEAEAAPESAPAGKPQAGHMGEMTPERLERGFRSQLVWDATMAESIARAVRGGAGKVIHLVGQFHCDFQGGTVQQTRARLRSSNLRILVISLQRDDATSLREDDRGRADVVIYTGKPAAAAAAAEDASDAARPQPAHTQPAEN